MIGDRARLAATIDADLLGGVGVLPWRWILIAAIVVMFALWVIAAVLARAGSKWHDPTSIAGRFVHSSTKKRPRWPRS